MERISKHFTYQEMVFSDYATRHGIDNTPGHYEYANLTQLVENVLDPLREHIESPIIVTSGYRCPELNRRIGGSKNSQHTKGQASDIKAVGWTASDLFELLRQNPDAFPTDQCILEFGRWVHVSYASADDNRGEYLIAKRRDGRTVYLKSDMHSENVWW